MVCVLCRGKKRKGKAEGEKKRRKDTERMNELLLGLASSRRKKKSVISNKTLE